MKNSKPIREAYMETNKYFVNLLDNAVEDNNNNQCLRLQELSKINENAYFVLYWGQFEAYINSVVLDFEGEDFEGSFMTKVQSAILPTHKYYDIIDKYYSWRNKLAHGNVGKLETVILPIVIDTFDEIIEAVESSSLPLGNIFCDIFRREGED